MKYAANRSFDLARLAELRAIDTLVKLTQKPRRSARIVVASAADQQFAASRLVGLRIKELLPPIWLSRNTALAQASPAPWTSLREADRAVTTPRLDIKMNERIALFIDGANFHQTVKSLGFEVDYKRLLSEFSSRGFVVRAFYYTVVREDGEFTTLRPLLDWLDYNGFTVRTKPAKEFDDGHGRRKIRRSMGVELAIDAIQLAKHIEHAYLFSGDGDLKRVVEAIQRLGVRVTVVSSVRSTSISDELRRQADNIIEIADLRSSIERTPHPIAPK